MLLTVFHDVLTRMWHPWMFTQFPSSTCISVNFLANLPICLPNIYPLPSPHLHIYKVFANVIFFFQKNFCIANILVLRATATGLRKWVIPIKIIGWDWYVLNYFRLKNLFNYQINFMNGIIKNAYCCRYIFCSISYLKHVTKKHNWLK